MANLHSEHMRALEQKLESVIQIGRVQNELYGRGLVFFLVDPVARKFVTHWITGTGITQENLQALGFPQEALQELAKLRDAYRISEEFGLVAATMKNGRMERYSAMVMKITAMLEHCYQDQPSSG